MKRFAFALAVIALAVPLAVCQQPPRPTPLPGVAGPLAAKYQADADRIVRTAMADTDSYNALQYLCDYIGNRNSGTPQLNVAIQWAAEQMRKAGLQNVRIQPVMVPHWVRGQESAELVGPVNRKLHMIGLGGSIATPKEGIIAEVVFVTSFDELDALPNDKVKGRIVVFDPGWHGYGINSAYRGSGPSRAAAKGAVAALVRSATGLAQQLPHTGGTGYNPQFPKIPAAAISIEDAAMIGRLSKAGPVKVHLQMEAHMEPEVEAGNVIGELVGSEHPEQVVVLGGHTDSWDVGQGAQDDGGGMMATLGAVSVLRKLNFKPRRTIRVVLWVNEENGGAGSKAYRRLVGDDIKNHVAAIEMDGGAELPVGMGYGTFAPRGTRVVANAAAPVITPEEQKSVEVMQDITSMLKGIGADSVTKGGGGSDIGPLTNDGVPSLSPQTVGDHYFDWHHTDADTFDKIDLQDFRKNIAMLAVVSYVLADMDGRLAGRITTVPPR